MTIATWDATLWLGSVIDRVEHETQGLARLLRQYVDRPRVEGFLSAYLEQVQSLDDLAIEVMTQVWPLTAIGAQIDVLGKIVGRARGGMLDDEYRLWVLAKIFINRSNGRIEEFYDVLDILGFTGHIIREAYPCLVVVELYEAIAPSTVFDLLDTARAAGARLDLVYSTTTRAATFRASSIYGGDDTTAANGAGSVYDGSVGGASAGEFTS